MAPHNPLLVPLAAVVALILIGGSVYFALIRNDEGVSNDTTLQKKVRDVRPPSARDHIIGNPAAPIVFVEYSDFECPFCKEYHSTLKRLVEEYGKEGNVAWVFRQFPIAQLHSKAPTEALASECVAEIGGNDAFWRFINELFATTPGNNNLDLAKLPELAEKAGVDRAAFEACMQSGHLMARVEEDFKEATAAGANGTPFTVVFAMDQQSRIKGAQPYPALTAIVQTILKQRGEWVPPSEAPREDVPWQQGGGAVDDSTATATSDSGVATSSPQD